MLRRFVSESQSPHEFMLAMAGIRFEAYSATGLALPDPCLVPATMQEDDADLSPRFSREWIEDLVARIGLDFDVVNLLPTDGFCEWKNPAAPFVDKGIRKLYWDYGRTTGVLYSRKGVHKILSTLPTSYPIDQFIQRQVKRGIIQAYAYCEDNLLRFSPLQSQSTVWLGRRRLIPKH